MRIWLAAMALAAAPLLAQDDDPCWDARRAYERALSAVEGYKSDIERELDNIERWGEVKEAGYRSAAAEFKNALKDAKNAAKACAKAATSLNPVTKGVQIVKASTHLTTLMNRLGAILVGRSGVDLRVGAYKRLQGLEGLLKAAEADANAAYDRYRACCDGLKPPGGDPTPRPPDPPGGGGGPTTTPGSGSRPPDPPKTTGGSGTGTVGGAGGGTGAGAGDATGGPSAGSPGGKGTVVNPPHRGDGFEVVETSPTGLRVKAECAQGDITEIRTLNPNGDWRIRFRGRGNSATITRTRGEDTSVKVRCISGSGEIREHAELRISGQGAAGRTK